MSQRRGARWALSGITALAFLATPAFGPIYMKYDGIDGDVTAAGHEKWIEVQSLQFGGNRWTAATSRSAASVPAAAGGAGGGQLTFTRRLDASSPELYLACAKGKPLGTMKLHLCDPGARGAEAYMRYEFENCLVTRVEASGGAQPMEEVSLSYGKVTWTPAPERGQGTLAGKPEKPERKRERDH